MSVSFKRAVATVVDVGPDAGRRAVELHLSGCNLWSGADADRSAGAGPCSRWCDADIAGGEQRSVEDVVRDVRSAWGVAKGKRLVVLTGGEPLLQLKIDLVHALQNRGFEVAIETNGTVWNPVIETVDTVVVSPKRGTSWWRCGVANAIKVVLPGDDAGGWTDDELDHIADTHPQAMLIVQPCDPLVRGTGLNPLLPTELLRRGPSQLTSLPGWERCMAVVARDARWRLGLQVHKLVGLP